MKNQSFQSYPFMYIKFSEVLRIKIKGLSMLDRSKTIIDDAINTYVKNKTDRSLTPWVAEKRKQEIKHIRENIFQHSKSTTELVTDLIVYITRDMYKGA